MKEERDPDLQFPDEKNIEERVRRMMDASVTDEANDAIRDNAEPHNKPVIINVSHQEEGVPSAPSIETKEKPTTKNIVITHFSDKPVVVNPVHKPKSKTPKK